MKNILLILGFISCGVCASSPPLNFICEKDKYIIYESVNNDHAAIKNGVLMSSTKGYENPYGEDENALIFEFDQWGQNGGMHVHHFFVFSPSKKNLTLTKQTLDADNIPRSDGVRENCKINL